MKSKRRSLFTLLFIVLAVFALAGSAQAATKNKWVKRSGDYYYYNAKGKAVKNGKKKIKGKYYFFDADGVQHTGWRYYRGEYYYFQQKNGKNGYMLTNKTVDGVYLDEDGAADFTSNRARRKTNIIARAGRLLDKLTTAGMGMNKKKQFMFRYIRQNYKLREMPDLTGQPDPDVAYAEWMLDHGYGDRKAFAALFAYVMKAIGYADPILVISDTDAWVECKERIYDPGWAVLVGPDLSYNVPYKENGIMGHPNWLGTRKVWYHVNRAISTAVA